MMPDQPFVLQPMPDSDDDLLGHYASPRRAYDPLPLELFPRPDRWQEEEQSSLFPCYKYFDLTKYTEEEARQLAAMDLIPKDAVKKVDDVQNRAKRLKRSTAESANVAGYYRFRNEGVDLHYSAKETPKPASSSRPKRNVQPPPPKDSTPIFSSILRNPNRGSPSSVGKTEPNGKMFFHEARKQGNRADFLAGLRQNMLKPNLARKPDDLHADGIPPPLPTSPFKQSSSVSSLTVKRQTSVPNPKASLFKHAGGIRAVGSGARHNDMDSSIMSLPEDELNSSGTMDLSVDVMMAEEVLGASDDEASMGFQNF